MISCSAWQKRLKRRYFVAFAIQSRCKEAHVKNTVELMLFKFKLYFYENGSRARCHSSFGARGAASFLLTPVGKAIRRHLGAPGAAFFLLTPMGKAIRRHLEAPGAATSFITTRAKRSGAIWELRAPLPYEKPVFKQPENPANLFKLFFARSAGSVSKRIVVIKKLKKPSIFKNILVCWGVRLCLSMKKVHSIPKNGR